MMNKEKFISVESANRAGKNILLFYLPVDVARQRLANNISLDRFEQEQADFFERVRAGYHRRVLQNPQRYIVVNAAQSIDTIKQKLEKIIFSL